MRLFALLAFLLLPLSGFAQVPDCWTVDGSEMGKNSEGLELADGEFLITAETAEMTKENLVELMQKVNFGNLRPERFPMIFDSLFIFHVSAVKEDAERNELIKAVNQQLVDILAVPGAQTIGCNTISRPVD